MSLGCASIVGRFSPVFLRNKMVHLVVNDVLDWMKYHSEVWPGPGVDSAEQKARKR
jgi:hypothetical protein